MSKNVIVVMVAELLLFLGEEDQLFGVLALVGARVCQFFHAAAARPLVAEPVAEGRRHEAEERLRDWVVKECPQADEVANLPTDRHGERLQVAGRYDAVAMGKVEGTLLDGGGYGCAVDMNARFAGEPSERPNIVVADEVMYFYAAVRQVPKGVEEGAVGLLVGVAPEVLVPEIEHVAEEVDSRGILRHGAQQRHQATLVFAGVRDGTGTEMGIRKKVNHVIYDLLIYDVRFITGTYNCHELTINFYVLTS